MTLTPLTGGLLAVGVLIAATVAWSLTRTKRLVAGARGPKRYQPPQNQPARRSSGSKTGLRAMAIWGPTVALIAWVALSLASPSKAPETAAGFESQPAQTEPATSKEVTHIVSSSLSPPPPAGSAVTASPTVPTAPPAAETTAVAVTTGGVPAPPPQTQPPGQSSIQNAAISISNPASATPNDGPLGTFAPDDQAFEPITEGAISQAALSMAPDVSRMEPVGLSFQKDAPKPAKILTPAPERPKLTAPPKPVPAAPLAVSNSSGPVTYTLLLGSFGKPENAERLRLQLVEEGLPVLVSEHKGNDNKIWYRVMSGDFDSQAEAESYGVELRKKFNIDKTFIFKNKK